LVAQLEILHLHTTLGERLAVMEEVVVEGLELAAAVVPGDTQAMGQIVPVVVQPHQPEEVEEQEPSQADKTFLVVVEV